MENIIIPESCKGCGKCCIKTADKDKPISTTCPKCSVRLTFYYGRCENLTTDNECKLYEGDRPQGCRDFQRGSQGCIESIIANS